MTIAVTRNVPPKVRGFLASVMLEVAPGVYTSPRMTVAVRDRIQKILLHWAESLIDYGILFAWPDKNSSCGQGLWILGDPPIELVDHDGIFLGRRSLSKDLRRSLEKDGLT